MDRALLKVDGYELFDNLGSDGRGICLYVHKSLTAVECSMSSAFEESVFATVHLPEDKRLLVGCVYRSPNTTQDNNIELGKLLQEVGGHSASHKLLLGDFNFPDIEWEDVRPRNAASEATVAFCGKHQ